MLHALDPARGLRPRTAMPKAGAAVQHNPGLVLSLLRGHEPPMPEPVVPHPKSSKREVFIQGLTLDGKTFRPSDWAERLAGAMASRSPYCVPNVIGGIKCVVVNEALRELEPMAWDFVMNFARDNQLQVADACLLPDAPAEKPRP